MTALFSDVTIIQDGCDQEICHFKLHMHVSPSWIFVTCTVAMAALFSDNV